MGTNLISFTIDAYLDLVDTAAYAIMRYSFSCPACAAND